VTSSGFRHGIVIVGSALLVACAASLDTDGKDARDCRAEPLGQMTAFLEEDAAPFTVRLTGTVVATSAGPAKDAYRYVIRDVGGAERRLAYRAPGGPLPVKEGSAYDFQVDYVGGAPAASGLLIRDRTGLVFAGATDTRLGSHVLKEGLSDLALALVASGCSSRQATECYESITNQVLRVTLSGRTADLSNGQSAHLGPYRITCLTAQAVSYRARCADAGLPAVSYLVSRTE
jgi:hypothetical protein